MGARRRNDDELDALIAGALERPGMPRRLRRGRAALAAAPLALLLLVVAWLRWPQPDQGIAPGPGPIAPEVVRGEPVDRHYFPVRVVLSLGSQPKTAGEGQDWPADAPRARRARAAAKATPADPVLAAFDSALSERRIDDALRLLTDASDAQRAAGLRRLGQALRSALSAEQVLSELPASEQLEACAQWALDPHLRPIALSRLRAILADERRAAEVEAIVARLAREPEMRGWLQSYGLVRDSVNGPG